ncbi:MFS transporter [Paludibacterium purpuratum]|uniref:MFS transporter n=1 Tax=Paludibacterium purpuratum TaxID=1144873 RepID=A0A4R7B762_9NEIS|nr:MFS transporter [Paludibacterium purpuratum]TDR80580.1 MFS transporter [Paludibacterium purpuratum]
MSPRIYGLLLSRFLSALGDQLLLFAVPLIVYRSTGSIRMSGLAFFIEWLPRVLSLPIAGQISDRFGGKRLYIGADALRALACLTVALWVADQHQVPIMAVMLMMGGCAFAYAQAFIALETSLPQLVSPAQMPTAQSALQAIDQTSAIAGPAAASLLMLWLTPEQLLWLTGSAFALSAIGAQCFCPALARPDAKIKRPALWHHWRASGAKVLGHPVLRALVILSVSVNLIAGLALASGAAITLGRFGLDPRHFGSLQGSVGILAVCVLLAVPILLRWLSVYRLGIASYTAIALGGLLMASAANYPLFVLGYAICFAACGSFNVFIRSERLLWIAEAERGSLISLIVLFNQLSLPLAGLLISLADTRHGPQWLFYPASLLACLLILALHPGLHRQAGTARVMAE